MSRPSERHAISTPARMISAFLLGALFPADAQGKQIGAPATQGPGGSKASGGSKGSGGSKASGGSGAPVDKLVRLPDSYRPRKDYLLSKKKRGRRVGEWLRRLRRPKKRRERPRHIYLDRFQYEFLLSIFGMVKQFYTGLENEQDKCYGHIGNFTALYRHNLFKGPVGSFRRRLSLVGYAFQIGVDTPFLVHRYKGGWMALELDAYNYGKDSDRLLFRLAPLGLHNEKAYIQRLGWKGDRWRPEAVGSFEGLWRLGLADLSISASMMPRYSRTWAFRMENELSLRIRVPVDPLAPLYISEVVLVPKFLHVFNSSPLRVGDRDPENLSLMEQAGLLNMGDFRHHLMGYIQVEFRIGR